VGPGGIEEASPRHPPVEAQPERGARPENYGRMLCNIANRRMQRSDWEAARSVLEQALEKSRAKRWRNLNGFIMKLIGLVYSKQHDFETSQRWLEDTLNELYRAGGQRTYIADAYNTLGEQARLRGALPEAARAYQRAREILVKENASRSVIAILDLNIGLAWLMRKQHDIALSFFQTSLTQFSTMNRSGLVAASHILCLCCVAAEPSERLWRQHHNAAVEIIAKTGWTDEDNTWPLEDAATLALEHGYHARARQALELALDQYTRLKSDDAIVRVQARLDALEATER